MSAVPLTFAEFYPRYLREHSQRGTRILHFVGTILFLVSVVLVAITGRWGWLAAGVVAAYGFAWAGHFFVEHNFVEHNRPATFQHPWFSLLGDFRLYADLWRGREKL